MKKLIYIALAILLVVTFIGCDKNEVVVPDVPDEVVVPDVPDEVVVADGIVCEGGVYSVFFGEWSATNCEGDEQVAGTYWRNKDGRMFRLGKAIDIDGVFKVYGKCPVEYIEEIELKE